MRCLALTSAVTSRLHGGLLGRRASDAVHHALTCVRDVCSQLNFDNFAAVANAALGTNLSPSFDVFTNDFTFLLACYTFEDVGVTAYHVRA